MSPIRGIGQASQDISSNSCMRSHDFTKTKWMRKRHIMCHARTCFVPVVLFFFSVRPCTYCAHAKHTCPFSILKGKVESRDLSLWVVAIEFESLFFRYQFYPDLLYVYLDLRSIIRGLDSSSRAHACCQPVLCAWPTADALAVVVESSICGIVLATAYRVTASNSRSWQRAIGLERRKYLFR